MKTMSNEQKVANAVIFTKSVKHSKKSSLFLKNIENINQFTYQNMLQT